MSKYVGVLAFKLFPAASRASVTASLYQCELGATVILLAAERQAPQDGRMARVDSGHRSDHSAHRADRPVFGPVLPHGAARRPAPRLLDRPKPKGPGRHLRPSGLVQEPR